jgi:hypothetical protein
LRVPPVPRFWGPGRGSRTAGSASTQAVASLSREPGAPSFRSFIAEGLDSTKSRSRAPQSQIAILVSIAS